MKKISSDNQISILIILVLVLVFLAGLLIGSALFSREVYIDESGNKVKLLDPNKPINQQLKIHEI